MKSIISKKIKTTTSVENGQSITIKSEQTFTKAQKKIRNVLSLLMFALEVFGWCSLIAGNIAGVAYWLCGKQILTMIKNRCRQSNKVEVDVNNINKEPDEMIQEMNQHAAFAKLRRVLKFFKISLNDIKKE